MTCERCKGVGSTNFDWLCWQCEGSGHVRSPDPLDLDESDHRIAALEAALRTYKAQELRRNEETAAIQRARFEAETRLEEANRALAKSRALLHDRTLELEAAQARIADLEASRAMDDKEYAAQRARIAELEGGDR